jgi:hypothetical protein
VLSRSGTRWKFGTSNPDCTISLKGCSTELNNNNNNNNVGSYLFTYVSTQPNQ